MSTFSTVNKNNSSWSTVNISAGVADYLLCEDGGRLLQENTDKLILDQWVPGGVNWNTVNKS